jgi:hypothetical protein
MRVPSTTKWADFCKFVAQTARVDFDPAHDTILLYRKDFTGDGADAHPIHAASYPTIQYLFYSGAKRLIFYRLLKGVDSAELANGFLLVVDFTEDFRTVTKSIEVPLPRNTNFAEFRARLETTGFLNGETRRLCFLSFSDGRVTPCHDRDWIYEQSRYVIAPDPGERPPGQEVVYVVQCEIGAGDYLDVGRLFAPIRVAEGMRLADVRPAIGEALGIGEAVMKQAKIFEGDKWVSFTAGGALKDDADIGAMRTGETLFVVTSTKRKAARWRQPEEAVKIDN